MACTLATCWNSFLSHRRDWRVNIHLNADSYPMSVANWSEELSALAVLSAPDERRRRGARRAHDRTDGWNDAPRRPRRLRHRLRQHERVGEAHVAEGRR